MGKRPLCALALHFNVFSVFSSHVKLCFRWLLLVFQGRNGAIGLGKFCLLHCFSQVVMVHLEWGLFVGFLCFICCQICVCLLKLPLLLWELVGWLGWVFHPERASRMLCKEFL